jgi:Zn-dependent protease with chaperone function
VRVVPTPDSPLTAGEQQILASFRQMDARRKDEALVRMARIANTHPTTGKRISALRLVATHGKAAQE